MKNPGWLGYRGLYYPLIWGLFHKPWHKDPYFSPTRISCKVRPDLFHGSFWTAIRHPPQLGAICPAQCCCLWLWQLDPLEGCISMMCALGWMFVWTWQKNGKNGKQFLRLEKLMENTLYTKSYGSIYTLQNHLIEKDDHLNQTSMTLSSMLVFRGVGCFFLEGAF